MELGTDRGTSVTRRFLLYFQDSLQEGEQIQQLLLLVEEKKTELCLYVCEDSSHFSTDEFFSTIRTFRRLFLKTIEVSSQSDAGPAGKANNGEEPFKDLAD